MSKNLLVIVGAALVLTFGILVWPGLYHYDKLDQKMPVKINRITGDTQVLTNKGWINLGEYQPPQQLVEQSEKETTQPYEIEIKNIKAVGDGNGNVHVTGEVKNNSKLSTLVTLQATVYDKDGDIGGVGVGSSLKLGRLEPTQTKGFEIDVKMHNAPKGVWDNYKVEVRHTY